MFRFTFIVVLLSTNLLANQLTHKDKKEKAVCHLSDNNNIAIVEILIRADEHDNLLRYGEARDLSLGKEHTERRKL